MSALGRDGLARLAPHDNPSAPRRTSLTRSLLWMEVVLVMGVSLGRSGVYALVNLIATWTAPGGLSEQHAVLNGSRAPGREWLDLSLQFLAIVFSLVPAFLAGYLLVRDGEDLRLLWVRPSPPLTPTPSVAWCSRRWSAGRAWCSTWRPTPRASI